MSNGGGFVNTLACSPSVSPRIAAFAPVSGAYYKGNNLDGSDCHPARSPLPILEFHGLADQTISYDGGLHRGVILPGIFDWISHWARRNGCSESDKPAIATSMSGQVTHYTWECSQGFTQHYAIAGLGHKWPSTDCTYLDATPLIVNFFNQYSLNTVEESQ
jgi:poly(3-hydroxybutyrate) depolymerase